MKKSIFGLLFVMLGQFMLICVLVSLYFCVTSNEKDIFALLIPSLGSMLLGGVLRYMGKHDKDAKLTRADSFLIVALCWVLFSFMGMLPYLLYVPCGMDVASAYFETMSGFTTTGSTVMENIDAMPHGLLLWRSMTQWIGGLGIVVVAVALLPFMEFKNSNVFQAETTGISLDKLKPRIGDTARRLLTIYSFITALCALLYWMGPMNIYDACCHALTTMATGGFSTHQASIGYFHSAYVEYVASLFMIIASINFSLYYYLSIRKGKTFIHNEEMQTFMVIVVGAVAIFTLFFHFGSLGTTDATVTPGSNADILRSSLFHVSTIISSTGFQGEYYDYMQWGPFFWMATVLIMIIGACAGSTGGGVKVIRVLIYLKWLYRDFVLQLHPRAVINVKINNHIVPGYLVRRVMGFLMTYFVLILIGVLIFAIMGYGIETSVGTLVTMLSNNGPGTGEFGPAYTFASLSPFGKWLLSFYMLVGRLEIFTVFIIFLPAFWQQKRLENGITTHIYNIFHNKKIKRKA